MTSIRLATFLTLFFVLGAFAYAQEEIAISDHALSEIFSADLDNPSTSSLPNMRGSIDKVPKGLDLSIIPGDLPPPSLLPPPVPLQQVLNPPKQIVVEMGLFSKSNLFSAARFFGGGRKTETNAIGNSAVLGAGPPNYNATANGETKVAASANNGGANGSATNQVTVAKTPVPVKRLPPTKVLPPISSLTKTEQWKTITLANGRTVKAAIDRKLDGKYHLRLEKGGRMTLPVEQIVSIK